MSRPLRWQASSYGDRVVHKICDHLQDCRSWLASEVGFKNYDQDGENRLQFQGWINQLWQDKDALLAQMHREYPAK